MTRRITVTYSTIGQAGPASVSEGRWYRYNGDRPLEAIPERQMAGGAARTERRERRITEFAAALADLGEPDPWKVTNSAVIAAGVQVGVGEKTAMSYRTALRKRQPQHEEAPGA
jgi:hypothetical protein